jgi:hypothetical protein
MTIKMQKVRMAPVASTDSIIDEFEIFTRKDPNQIPNTKHMQLYFSYGRFIRIECDKELLTITTFSRINGNEMGERKYLLAEMERLGLMEDWVIMNWKEGVFSPVATP